MDHKYAKLDGPQCCGSGSFCSNRVWIVSIISFVGVAVVLAVVISQQMLANVTTNLNLMGMFSPYPGRSLFVYFTSSFHSIVKAPRTTYDLGYMGELNNIAGSVDMTFQGGAVDFKWDLEGLDPTCTQGPIAGQVNSCGIHIHVGLTCEVCSICSFFGMRSCIAYLFYPSSLGRSSGWRALLQHPNCAYGPLGI